MKKIKGFTLAEVLITLAIIGVVAALTIPSVITNYRKNLYVTQLKKEYNYFTNAFHTAMANDGVTKLSDTKLCASISPTLVQTGPTSYMSSYELTPDKLLKSEFSESKEELSKIFNIVAIYDGYMNKIPVENNRIEYKMIDGTACAPGGNCSMDKLVCLADGACFWFNLRKDPNTAFCGGNTCGSLKEFQASKNTSTKLWQQIGFLYIDINGFQKGPNQWGRDYFNFEISNDGGLYPVGGNDYAVYAPNPYYSYWKNNSSSSIGCNPDSTYAGTGCAARIIENGWKMDY